MLLNEKQRKYKIPILQRRETETFSFDGEGGEVYDPYLPRRFRGILFMNPIEILSRQ